MRTRLRSSYSARSTSAGATPSLRAWIERKTVTASVACRQTSDRATVERVAPRVLAGVEPVPRDEPRTPLRDVDPVHQALLPT